MSCCCSGCQNLKTPKCRCGFCATFQGSMFSTMKNINCKCLQVFFDNENWSCHRMTKDDQEKTKKLCLQEDRSFYVHAPLWVNLGNPLDDKHIGYQALVSETRSIQDLPASVVSHIGFGDDLNIVSEHLDCLKNQNCLKKRNFERSTFPLLLECSSGKKRHLGHTWEDLRHLYEKIDTDCFGFCLDTQHAFSSGMCSFENEEKVIECFEHACSLSKNCISLIHLNDSKVEYQNGNDKHAPLEEGYIWYKNSESLKVFVELASEFNIDIISETTKPIQDMKLIESYFD